MTDRDIEIMAKTIYGEARGEGEEGMEAVACVIMNRYNARKTVYRLPGRIRGENSRYCGNLFKTEAVFLLEPERSEFWFAAEG